VTAEAGGPGASPFRPEHFEREDESPDGTFYVLPRLVVHIDDGAIAALRRFLAETLPSGADILDLMSSWRSHLPEGIAYGRVAGLGLNAVELAENPQLTERLVCDLNALPELPFARASFDAALVTVSVQYLTRPLEVFAEVARALRPGGAVVISFSNRMFPTKAVRLWRATGDAEHAQIVAAYLHHAGGFSDIRFQDRSPAGGDPLFVVAARRRSSATPGR